MSPMSQLKASHRSTQRQQYAKQKIRGDKLMQTQKQTYASQL